MRSTIRSSREERYNRTSLFQTRRADWFFLIPATLIFISALLVTTWDFVYVQGMIFRFGMANASGLVLFSIGVCIRIVARRTLGKYFSSGLKASRNQELIKHGIYKYVRHPAYLGSDLLSIGIPLTFSSLYGLFLMLGLMPCFQYRMKVEESMLLEKFGDEYREYVRKTKKLIPFVY